jgi:hypothetical protein
MYCNATMGLMCLLYRTGYRYAGKQTFEEGTAIIVLKTPGDRLREYSNTQLISGIIVVYILMITLGLMCVWLDRIPICGGADL